MKESTAKKLMEMTNELYEEEAESFNETRNQLWEKEILEFLAKIKPGSSVLDLGCGNARLYRFLPKKSIKYLGIDNSKKMITMNCKKYPDAEFRVGDGLTIKFKNKFDYIVSIAVLHHIPSEKLQLMFLKNIYNSLKTNGQMLISVWNRWQPRYRKYFSHPCKSGSKSVVIRDLERYDIMVPWMGRNHKRFIHVFKPQELNTLAKKAGFKNIWVFASKHGKKTNLKEALNIYLIGKKCETG